MTKIKGENFKFMGNYMVQVMGPTLYWIRQEDSDT